MKSSAIKYLSENGGLGQSDASTLIEISSRLARSFEGIMRHYDFDNLEKTQQLEKSLREHDRKDRLGRMLNSRPTAPYAVSAMWKEFGKAEKELERFSSANSQFRTSRSTDEMLTLCLEALHSARSLSNADKVGDGRRCFETLRSNASAARRTGLLS